MRRILCCRTDAIGDLILTLPVVRSIKEANPDAQVEMLVSEYTAPLLENEKYINSLMTIPGRDLGSWEKVKSLGRELRTREVDTFVCFYPRLSLALAAWVAGVELRIGTARRGYSFLFNKKTSLHRKESGKHELDLNYELVEPHFAKLNHYEPTLTVSDSERNSSREMLRAHGVQDGEPYVVVHPGSRGSAPNWSLQNYLNLAAGITRTGYKTVLTGSSADRIEIDRSNNKAAAGEVNLAGESSLTQLKGLIKNAALVICGSTGPIHIAAAVGTFAVGIYPPVAALSPVRWGPRGGSNKLFVPAVDSSGRSELEIMNSITVETVSEFVISHLRADNSTRASI